ncbi:ABC transporter permease [Mangrovibrevibacter kandeliae]|uniref:ABC transporter permease n=1 Tax=Mangrovibrevibacter kandeliae TaxID=2968473 RepID=UPI002117685D|nr:ABC transporter permease [Aurantimonas sp. CSK15Z-1]MCQ8783086.1 ABC transporter permease [Aurantimonas sp. CSK15Z-1]
MPSLRLSSLALLAPPVLLLGVFFVMPLCYLLFVSFMTNSMGDLYETVPTLANYTEIVSDPFYHLIIERTLLSTAVILIACFLIGYPVALYASRLEARGRLLLLMALMVPLMVSNVVRAYGWVAILGRQGVVSGTLNTVGLVDRPMSFLYDFQAVTLGLLTILLPFMVITLTNSLMTIDERYREAAEALGAGPWRTFLRVTLPMSSPGIASGLMLVTFLTLSAYVTVALLGGPRYKLLVSFVFDSVSSFRWPRAAALSFVLLILALVVAAVIQIIVRPGRVKGRG